MRLLRDHFAGYRPLVTATALGAAAGSMTSSRPARQPLQIGAITGLRDNALITVGRSWATSTPRCSPPCNPRQIAQVRAPRRPGMGLRSQGLRRRRRLPGGLRTRATRRGSGLHRRVPPPPKHPADLNALLYADGIHDSLYRAAGRALTAPATAVRIPPQRAAMLADG